MLKLHVGCHAEVMLHQPRGQIPPLTTALTCLNAFKLPVRQTGCSLDLLWGCALALADLADVPKPLLLLQPRGSTDNGGWVVGAACHGKLDEMRAGFHSSDKCTGREEGCRGALPCTAPCTAQCAEPHSAGTVCRVWWQSFFWESSCSLPYSHL